MRLIRYLLVISASVALGAGGWLTYRLMQPPLVPSSATVLPAPIALPQFSLVDQHGRGFTLGDLKGQWNVVFFGFTHCPDICPVTLQVLASARRALTDAGHAAPPRIIFVSVDPERDTPEILRDYVEYFDAGAVGLTGSLEEIRKITTSLGIFFQKSPDGNGAYSVDHSAAVLVLDAKARFRAVFGAPHDIEEFVSDLPLVMAL